MKSDTDIVTRLRNAPWTTAEDCNEAADEIERLREELTASHESHGNEVGALTERLSLAIHERDEARRRLCIEWMEHGPVRLTKEQIAMRYGWDCFKENNND